MMHIASGDWDTHGIVKFFLNEMAVTVAGGARTLTIATGGAFVYGFPYTNSAAVTKTLTHPVVDTTGWRLVLRVGWAAQTVRITLVESADGTAAIPAVTQVANMTWDISLAYGTITTGDVVTITLDTRAFITGSGYIALANIVDSTTACSVVARSASTNGVHADLNATTNGFVLHRSANALHWGTLDTDSISDRTRTLFVPCTGLSVGGASVDRTVNNGWLLADAVTSYAFGEFYIPTDYLSTMTIKAVVQSDANGDCYCTHIAYYAAVTEAYDAANTSSAASAVALTAAQLTEIKSLAMAGVAAGDYVTIMFTRTAGNALDTINNTAYIKGWLVTYTADS